MGKSVLRYQFIAGLRAELKAKMVGCTGDFDELLSKARFEEARLREVRPERNQKKENEHSRRRQREPPPAQSIARNRPSGKGAGTCFTCGGLGHYARECPRKGRGLPLESTGKWSKARSSGQGKYTLKTVSTVISDRSEETEQGSVNHPSEPPSPIPTQRIVEKASTKRAADQSPPQWAKAVREWLQSSTVTLRSYGGDKLAIVSQVQCKLERGSHIVDTVLQVQEGAPVELLIGADILWRLGFGLVRQEGGGSATNLLSITPEEEEPTATVKLLHATRLPARHSRLVRVEVVETQEERGEVQLFQPEVEILGEKGLDMADAVVGVGVGGEATLVIKNTGAAAIRLEEGQVLGHLLPVIVIKDNTQEEPEKDSDLPVAMIHREDQGESRSKLLAALAIGETNVTTEELEELKELEGEFDNLFALTNDELWQTNIVEHSINTGGHRPVRQPPRRVPF